MDPSLLTIVVLAGIVVGLVREKPGPEIVMLSGLLVLVLAGVIGVEEALAGFASPSVVTIGALFAVGAGLRSTGAMEMLGRRLLGRPTPGRGLLRLLVPVAGLSAFMNNTPLVAMFLPVFVQWAKRLRISPSRLLMPLSYAAILGGTCTLIGTSTNLVVDQVLRETGAPGLGMFELTPVGIPIAVVGLAYLVTVGRRLLPDREDLLERIESHPREYTLEMIVHQDCPLAGRSVRDSGLRDLPGLYLYRIERGGRVITPVDPREQIHVRDVLSFSGIVSTVVDVQKIRGLEPAAHRGEGRLAVAGGSMHPSDSLDSMEGIPAAAPTAAAPRLGRQLCEAVISSSSPLVGRSIKDSNFRSQYNASVIAVHRSGHKLQQKIGQIVLQAGDTLLVDADLDFIARWRNSPGFILVSAVEDSAPVVHERAVPALAIFALVVGGMTAMTFVPGEPVVLPALAGALLMVLLGCISTSEVHRAVELPLLVLIGAALGVSQALEKSGAGLWLADAMLSLTAGHRHPTVILLVVYVVTNLMTELLSNTATAALMGGLAVTMAAQLGIDPRPLLIAVAIAASAGFATPIGYQTHLMVLGPGGYRFVDFLKVGLPLNVLVGVVSLALIPYLYR